MFLVDIGQDANMFCADHHLIRQQQAFIRPSSAMCEKTNPGYAESTVVGYSVLSLTGFVFHFIEEFIAHGAPVNCLTLGHKSGRVMVTGGEDRKVNTWAVGKPNCIMVRTGVFSISFFASFTGFLSTKASNSIVMICYKITIPNKLFRWQGG